MKVKNSLIGDLSGSIGGFTFFKNGSTQVARAKQPKFANFKNGQILVRQWTSQASAAWRILGADVKSAWQTLATSHSLKSGFMLFKTTYLRVSAFIRAPYSSLTGLIAPEAIFNDVATYFTVNSFTEPDYNLIQSFTPYTPSFLASIQRSGYGTPFTYNLVIEVDSNNAELPLSALANISGPCGLYAIVKFRFHGKAITKLVFSVPKITFLTSATSAVFSLSEPETFMGLSAWDLALCTGWEVKLYLTVYGYNWTSLLVSSTKGSF